MRHDLDYLYRALCKNVYDEFEQTHQPMDAQMSLNKLAKLQQQIHNLETKKLAIQQKRLQQIHKLIEKAGLTELDNATLYNAFDFIKNELKEKTDLAKTWQN